MCKLFGAVLSPPRVPEELHEFKYLALRDSDGWGVAWYNRGLKLVKSTNNALADSKYIAAVNRAKSNIVLAHLRAMTRGNKRTVNTHPFFFEKYVFAHNGTVDIKPLARYLKGKYRRVHGDTDSEVLFHFLIQNMEKWGHFMGLRKAVKEISKVALERKVTSINFILTDGSYLYALKRVYRGRNSLFYKTEKGFKKSFIISSKPLGKGWTEVENGQLIAVDASDGSVIRTKIL